MVQKEKKPKDRMKRKLSPQKIKTFGLVILILSAVFAFLALVLPDIISNSAYQMQVGDVANQDIVAPYSLSFESKLLTEKTKQEAAANIEPIYLPADPAIGRHQLESLRAKLYFITTIRQDDYSTLDQKISDVLAIDEIPLSIESAEKLITLDDQNWEAIQTEAASLLEQIMRNTIRTSNLNQVRNTIPSVVDYSFIEEHANLVIELVSSLIVPNSLYSEEKTQNAINDAVSSVVPVSRTFVSGETLIQRGQIISLEAIESLNAYNLIQRDDSYKEIIAAGLIVLVMFVFIGYYFSRRRLSLTSNLRGMLLVALTFVIFLYVARFFAIDRTIVPYLFPLAAFSLTLTVIFELEIGLVFTLALGILTAFGSPKGFDLTLFYIIPSLIGMLIISRVKRISTFFAAAIAIGLIGTGIILAYRLADSVTDWVGIATLSAASMVNGLTSASLALFLQHIFALWLDVVTSLQLMDLTRSDHPLLQVILKNAPGSYQHSLMVSNLAENAAESINANALLVRTGALFHDCGKTANPQFFIENQVADNINSHDDIDYVTSAATIIQHVSDGVDLAKKHHLPSQVINFIREHHGTLLTRYQYTQALKSTNDQKSVDQELFRYPGPKPQSKETALLMLADGMEARARAEAPKEDEELLALIAKVIKYYEQEGQLEDTPLTLKDLKTVSDSFFNTLKGIYHPRIQYPELTRNEPNVKLKNKPKRMEPDKQLIEENLHD